MKVCITSAICLICSFCKNTLLISSKDVSTNKPVAHDKDLNGGMRRPQSKPGSNKLEFRSAHVHFFK